MKAIRSLSVLVLLAMLTVGCGAKAYHVAVVSVVSAHTTASAVQDTADAFVCKTPTQTNCLSVEQRRAIAGKLSPAFGLTGKLAATIKAWPINAPLPVAVLAMLPEITQLLNDAIALLPSSAQGRVKALVESK